MFRVPYNIILLEMMLDTLATYYVLLVYKFGFVAFPVYSMQLPRWFQI